MKLLILGGRVLDPATDTDDILDIYVEDGKIVSVTKGIELSEQELEECEVINAKGMWVTPGLVDLNSHFREPGLEYKGTIRTESRAAARGGYTSVCMMPNTKPPIDNVDMLKYVNETAKEATDLHLYTVAAMTAGQEGEYLTDFESLKENGAIAVSDNGATIMNARTARQAMRLAAEIDIPVFAHCEDSNLAARGVMNAGERAKQYGFYGIMDSVEEVIVARDILLAKNTGARLHLTHLSTKDSILLVQMAKEQGMNITAEVTPHHFTLTEDVVTGEDANFKIAPPLRTMDDRDAIRVGLATDVIDVIVSDHAPHHESEKSRSFDEAPFGVVGLETAVPVTITELVKTDILTPLQMIEKMCYNPARILGIEAGSLEVGKAADIAVIDPDAEYVIDSNTFASMGRNTPFQGKKVFGKVLYTIVDGKVVYSSHGQTEIVIEREAPKR